MRANFVPLVVISLALTLTAQQTPSPNPQAPSAGPGAASPTSVPHDVEHPTPRQKSKDVPIDPPQLTYYTASSTVLDQQVHSVPASDAERFARLKTAFGKEDCSGDRMQVQQTKEGQNLICTWPGSTPSTIVVLAHYLRQGKGESAVDNWSGAAMLPYLYLAVQAAPRENTFVFVACAGKKGAADYHKSLSKQQRKQIRAVIDLVALGVSPVPRFFTPSDTADPSAAAFHLQLELLYATFSDRRLSLPQPGNPSRWLTADDTESFRYAETPAIVIHSIAQNDSDLPDSTHDVASAIHSDDYYWNYRTVAIYLAGLDQVASKLATNDPLWGAGGSGYRLNLNDLPWIH